MDNPRNKSINVVMLPWLAHSHVNPYLELAKRLTQELNNLSIHFCSTPIILESIRNTLNLQTRISLLEIHLPELAELPPHLHTTKHLPSHLTPMLIQAFAQSEQTFSHLLDTIKPDLIIFDIFQPWAARIALQRKIPAVLFLTVSTVSISFAAHSYFTPCKEFPFPEIGLTKENRRQKGTKEEEHIIQLREILALCWKLSEFVIARSFREIESKYIEYLSTLIEKEVVLTGALVPDISSVSHGDNQEEEKVMQWLERRERRSVVYASFGSECVMSYKEMEQLAHGLELSGACFILVAHLPNYDQNGEELLHGLLERVGPERGARGLVVSWAPQRNILLHRNLGCFLTHCGWSSVIEGMQAAIPILALPMDWDQPLNAKLIVDLGIGVEIEQHGLGNFTGEDVADAIKLILPSEKGESVRKYAEEMAEAMRNPKDDDIRILADKIVGLVSNVEAK